MVGNESFGDLLVRVRQGDNEAAAVIFERFVNRLAAQADRHLGRSVRRQADPEDVVQSVCRTFLRRVRDGQFRLDHWGSLWGLLTRITLCKCARAARRVQGNQNRSDFDSSLSWEVIARDPSPAEAACLSDTLDSLMKPLRESHRQIVALALQGYTQEEIGRKVGYTERTVRRVLSEVEARLDRMDRTESASEPR